MLLALPLLVGLVVGLLTGGSFRGLAAVQLRLAWLFLLGPVQVVYAAQLVMHAFLASVGTYLLARHAFGVLPLAAAAGGRPRPGGIARRRAYCSTGSRTCGLPTRGRSAVGAFFDHAAPTRTKSPANRARQSTAP